MFHRFLLRNPSLGAFVVLLALPAVLQSAVAAESKPEASGAAVAQLPNTLLVQTQDVGVSLEDVRRELQLLSEQGRTRALADANGLQTVVTRIYFRRRMALMAEQAGYTDDVLVQARLRRAREEALAEWLPQHVMDGMDAPDLPAMARAYYDENQDEFMQDERIYAGHILFKATDAETKAARREEAEAVLAQLRDGANFGDMAEEHSEDGSRYMKGDLGEFTRGRMVPEFDEAAFALQAGEISEVVESRFGWHIIKVYNREEATPVPFENVRERLQSKLGTEHRREALATWLRENAETARSALPEARLDVIRNQIGEELGVDVEAAEQALQQQQQSQRGPGGRDGAASAMPPAVGTAR